jgi:hypothetical protein
MLSLRCCSCCRLCQVVTAARLAAHCHREPAHAAAPLQYSNSSARSSESVQGPKQALHTVSRQSATGACLVGCSCRGKSHMWPAGQHQYVTGWHVCLHMTPLTLPCAVDAMLASGVLPGCVLQQLLPSQLHVLLAVFWCSCRAPGVEGAWASCTLAAPAPQLVVSCSWVRFPRRHTMAALMQLASGQLQPEQSQLLASPRAAQTSEQALVSPLPLLLPPSLAPSGCCWSWPWNLLNNHGKVVPLASAA